MKLPNGFGSIACYSSNRRRPYIVRKYIDGRQKIIGQYATYEDALAFWSTTTKPVTVCPGHDNLC